MMVWISLWRAISIQDPIENDYPIDTDFWSFFQKSECIYQCKLSDLPNQFNSENSQTRMLLVCVLGEQSLPNGLVSPLFNKNVTNVQTNVVSIEMSPFHVCTSLSHNEKNDLIVHFILTNQYNIHANYLKIMF